jgi:hypothetical protein
MRRVLLGLLSLAICAPLWASKTPRIPPHAPTGGAPATVTIAGSPLTVVVGGDTSMQVYNTNVPGTGQFYPPDCTAGQTADSGIFATIGGLVYGPDFDNHPCGSASNTYVPWTPVSLSPVTGTGTGADPFTVVIVVSAGATGVQLTETLTYVNGASLTTASLVFSNSSQAAVTFDAFIGGDLYLADNDRGFATATPSHAGGRGADANCLPLQYVISFDGTTPAQRYSANGYSQVWDEISAGLLSNTTAGSCLDNGAALQWVGRTVLPGGTDTIGVDVTFSGNATPLATVPTLSPGGLALMIAGLALVGWVLARRGSIF